MIDQQVIKEAGSRRVNERNFDMALSFARQALARTGRATVAPAARAFGARLFDYDTIKANIKESHAIESVEAAFGKLSKGQVDVPIPMHIGMGDTDGGEEKGTRDCHIKGGYVAGTDTWTVKLANVYF